MLKFEGFFANKRILVTGHTGFSGGWVCSWLNAMGASVSGISLAPESSPNLFDALGIDQNVDSFIGSINDAGWVKSTIIKLQPDLIIHLAAQPIVSVGYEDPKGTFETNVMGTLNVLDAASHLDRCKGVVCITTDKVYKNEEWDRAYCETDPLGGKDPYSASKSACEMVINTYREAIVPTRNSMLIATARGGNIIGGGDWAPDRIVPDFVRAALESTPLNIRNPAATRPWQHVIALVHGYLLLGAEILNENGLANQSWNFGPQKEGHKNVGALLERMKQHWPELEVVQQSAGFAESQFLHLSSDKSRDVLHWTPPLNFDSTVDLTMEWYKKFHTLGIPADKLVSEQLSFYRDLLSPIRTPTTCES